MKAFLGVFFGNLLAGLVLLAVFIAWQQADRKAQAKAALQAQCDAASRAGDFRAMALCIEALERIAEAEGGRAARYARYHRAEREARGLVRTVETYGREKDFYPQGIQVLREQGYALGGIGDKDPWGNDWVFSPAVLNGARYTPKQGDIYVYSRGPKGTGAYPEPFTEDTGPDGSVGYSSVHGAWRGR